MTPNHTLSVVVRAHPRRRNRAEALLDLAPSGLIRIIYDEKNDEIETCLRALSAYSEGATHHLILEDDAIVSPLLLGAVFKVLPRLGPSPLSLYFGQTRPHPKRTAEAFALAQHHSANLIRMAGPLWGVAVVHPVATLPQLIAGYEASKARTSDLRVFGWYRDQGIPAVYTIPSLVDHDHTAPSLLFNETKNPRKAYQYTITPLDIDWATTPMLNYTHDDLSVAPKAIGSKVTYRHVSGRTKTVWATGLIRESLEMSDVWERIG